MQHTTQKKITEKRTTISTLLIPKKYGKILKKRLKNKNMKLKAYLEFLISEYKQDSAIQEYFQSDKVNTQYQSAGQDLERWNFLVDNLTWAELTLFARSLGLSRTLLFMILFLIDIGELQIPLKHGRGTFGVPKFGQVIYMIFQERVRKTEKQYTRSLKTG